jgi:hypothetical protein
VGVVPAVELYQRARELDRIDDVSGLAPLFSARD